MNAINVNVNDINMQTLEVQVMKGETTTVTKVQIPEGSMEPKAMYKYAITQFRAWKAFAKSLGSMYDLFETVDGEIRSIPSTYEICDWITEYIESFDEDMVRLATSALIIEAITKKFEDVDFEESDEDVKTKIDRHINMVLSARKFTMKPAESIFQTAPTSQETSPTKKSPKKASPKKDSPKKASPKKDSPKKADDEDKLSIECDDKCEEEYSNIAPTTTSEEKKPEEETEKPKKKRVTKKKTTEETPAEEAVPIEEKKTEEEVDNKADTSSKNSEKKKRGPSPYNIFIKEEITRLRTENPELNNKVAMAMAVSAWKKVSPKKTTEESEPVTVETTETVTLEETLSA